MASGSGAKKFKLIRNKHILNPLRVKRLEKVLLFFCKIYSRRYYTLYFDELKIFCNITFHLCNVLRNRSDEVAAHEHKDLVAVLIAGDEEKARKLTLAHITTSHRMVLDALLTSPSLLAVNILPLRSN
jgi:hypothetical protein